MDDLDRFLSLKLKSETLDKASGVESDISFLVRMVEESWIEANDLKRLNGILKDQIRLENHKGD